MYSIVSPLAPHTPVRATMPTIALKKHSPISATPPQRVVPFRIITWIIWLMRNPSPTRVIMDCQSLSVIPQCHWVQKVITPRSAYRRAVPGPKRNAKNLRMLFLRWFAGIGNYMILYIVSKVKHLSLVRDVFSVSMMYEVFRDVRVAYETKTQSLQKVTYSLSFAP